jgi:GNAT superfamily N-acetyltransferase
MDLFEALLAAPNAGMIECQSNDAMLTVMLHVFGETPRTEKILFEDARTTTYRPEGALFRRIEPGDAEAMSAGELDTGAGWGISFDGRIVAAGDVLYHYNPPYGDIYMKVAERYRRHGLGSYLVQELKRVCREQGQVPCARCDPNNIASRRTLQNAGFAPCAVILSAPIRR